MVGATLFIASVVRVSAAAGEAFRIANGATVSNILSSKFVLFDAEAITLYAPNGLAETVTIQLSPDYAVDAAGNVSAAGTWFTLVDSTLTAVKCPTANNVVVYNGIITGFTGMKLVAGVAVAGNRDYMMWKMFRG